MAGKLYQFENEEEKVLNQSADPLADEDEEH